MNERLYEIIEAAAETKSKITLRGGECLQLTMISSTKFRVEDLYWVDEKRNVCKPILEAEYRYKDIFPGLYVVGLMDLYGTSSGDTMIFRKEHRYNTIY